MEMELLWEFEVVWLIPTITCELYLQQDHFFFENMLINLLIIIQMQMKIEAMKTETYRL